MHHDRCATIQEADYEYARNVGRERPDLEWILSDRDACYRNPFYTGPRTTWHPDADGYYADEEPGPAVPNSDPFADDYDNDEGSI
ncbi:MAG: hypothetical protein KAX77_01220 [Xanthomonadales bacterium]|nr:hypothetical protein [Xanthomonadales bacterium]